MARPMQKIRLREILESYDFDPVREMIDLHQTEDVTNRLKFEINREFMSYLYPKQKAVQMSADAGAKVTFAADFGESDKKGTKE